jgi:hypothetical protein
VADPESTVRHGLRPAQAYTDTSAASLQWDRPLALVLGSESSGITDATWARVSELRSAQLHGGGGPPGFATSLAGVYIPTHRPGAGTAVVDSLNVGHAAAILLAHAAASAASAASTGKRAAAAR